MTVRTRLRLGDHSRDNLIPQDDSLLSVNDVTVNLNGRRVLDHVSFSLSPRTLTALIGSNGAGKTTLLRVILGLQPAPKGRILLTGVPADRQRTSIGYVPQKLSLDPDMPIRCRDFVSLGADGHRMGFRLPSKHRRHETEELLAAVGAEHLADARVGAISGGEQQRVLIAHALASRPKLLLLDEPLANLDLHSAHEVATLLRRIATDQDIAVLISAHEMNALLPVLDTVVYLADGRAVSGPQDDVIRSDVLSDLYGRPVEVLRVQGRILVIAGEAATQDAPVPTGGL